MPIEPREDVERLFVVDRVPPEAIPLYDNLAGNRVLVRPIPIDPIWDYPILVLGDLRSQVVNCIMSVKESGMPPVHPLNLCSLHEMFVNRDVCLRSLLVNPEFVPLLEKVPSYSWGERMTIFEHWEIPPGELFALAEPEFVGIVAITREGPGAALINPNGVSWGYFQFLKKSGV